MEDGLFVYDNPSGVLTNNPPFPMQMFNLNNFMSVSAKEPKNLFSEKLSLKAYSRGMGALGLPGDLSSQSRFVRAAFARLNSVSGEKEDESVSQFFHILDSVKQIRGLCELESGKYEITIYTSCANASRGIYYYTTYDNSRITAVSMQNVNLDGNLPVSFPLVSGPQVLHQNEIE
jgi:choloylglycine hydrolase